MTTPPHTPTIREHAEAIRDRCRPIPGGTPAEHQAFEHAQAILAALDAAPRNHRLVYYDAWSTPRNVDGREFRLVPDPGPGRDNQAHP